MQRFFLGVHQPGWLAKTAVPLCVSRTRLAARKSLPRARGPWFLDSGGFTELNLHGRWRATPAAFVTETRRLLAGVGPAAAVAPMDWMCEPVVVQRTGLSVVRHQELTTANYGELLALAPEVPWVPVLQGWEAGDYLRHLEGYDRAGFNLRQAPLVAVGTVCRRQHTREAAAILGRLAAEGLRLHAFGLKVQGLERCAGLLTSADSMAWSFEARRLQRPWCGSTTHKNCASCLAYCLHWQETVMARLARHAGATHRQLQLEEAAA